jgi:hypothetical protein
MTRRTTLLCMLHSPNLPPVRKKNWTRIDYDRAPSLLAIAIGFTLARWRVWEWPCWEWKLWPDKRP